MPPGPICTGRQGMKPPRKLTERRRKQSSSHSRTRLPPTTRCATHFSPQHRLDGFCVQVTGRKASGNVELYGDANRPFARELKAGRVYRTRSSRLAAASFRRLVFEADFIKGRFRSWLTTNRLSISTKPERPRNR